MPVINGAFLGQRVTGQQRYAREISERLIKGGFEIRTPRQLVLRGGAIFGWTWTQCLSLNSRQRPLLSLTGRVPIWHPDHIPTFHDFFPITHPEWYTKRFAFLHSSLLKRQLASSRRAIAVSPITAETARQLGYRGELVVAPNAPADIFSQEDSGAPLPRGVPSHFVLAVGSHDPRKNLERLVEAFTRLPAAFQAEHPLLLVGTSQSSIFASTRVPEVPNVRVIGYVSDMDLAGLYKRASAVVIPSLDEGFGLPLVEGAVAGASLAVSRIPAFTWILDTIECDVPQFDPYNIRQIGEAIMHAVHRREAPLPRSMSAAVRFSWDASAKVIQDFVSTTGAV